MLKSRWSLATALAACALLTGCGAVESMADWERRQREWCRTTATSVIPGAELIGYADTVAYPDIECNATVRHKGKVFVVHVTGKGVVKTTTLTGVTD